MFWIYIILIVLGLILLIKGSDFFVDNAALIAKSLNVSNFIIGLTLVAVGTSLPELATTIIAALNNESGIMLGNIVGSNIANIGLIVGLTATLSFIKSKKIMFERDALILAFISIIFYFFASNLFISRIEGITLFFLFAIYLLYLSEEKKQIERKQSFVDFLDFIIKLRMLKTISSFSQQIFAKKEKEKRKKVFWEIFLALIGLSALIIGAEMLVKGTIFLADYLKISTTFIGLTLVAVGTSLPELMVSITAARKSFSDMVIGNILGSNIVNITLIFSIGVIINEVRLTSFALNFSILFMVFISLIFIFFMGSRKEIRKFEGLILLALYAFFLYISYVNAAII